MFIEQIMIFALGFLCAGLFSLLFLPAFWRRAMTLSRRQLEMQMPLSMAEIVAERDQLRAEFAAEQRRLEQRLEGAETARANDKIELGQRLMRNLALEDEIRAVKTEAAETSRTLQVATRSITSAEAELSTTAKQLYDVESALERRNTAFGLLVNVHEALKIQSAEQRTVIAGLETQLSGREADIEALNRDLARQEIEIGEARSTLELVRQERDQFRGDAHSSQARREVLQLDFEAQARRVKDLQNSIGVLEREKTRFAAELADAVRLLEEERKRVRDLSKRNAEHNEALKALENKAAQEADLARAGQAAMEGALAVQRRETEAARAEIAKMRDAARLVSDKIEKQTQDSEKLRISPVSDDTSGVEFPALRKAISEIGQDIARIAVELEKSGLEVPARAANSDSAISNEADSAAGNADAIAQRPAQPSAAE